MTARHKSALFTTALTLGLYFSGILVFITPLPFLYHHLKYPDRESYKVGWISLMLVAFVYAFGTEFFYGMYQTHPSMVWMFPIPVIELVQYFSPTAVTVLGLTYYAIYLALAYLTAIALRASSKEIYKILFWTVLGNIFGGESGGGLDHLSQCSIITRELPRVHECGHATIHSAARAGWHGVRAGG